MFVYLSLLFFVSFWIFLEKITLNRRAFWIPCLALIFFATFRDYTIGTDTPTYTSFFRGSISVDNYIFDPRVEYGYQLFEYFILNISKQYFLLFFASSSIIVTSILYVIKKYSVNYFLSVFIYISFAFYTFYFNTLRQGISIAICMLGIYFFINKKIIPYFFIILLASTFHISAWIMLLIYFVVHHLQLKIEIKAIICFLFTFFCSKIIIGYMASDNDRYAHYTENADNAGGYLLTFFYLLIAFLVYLGGKDLRKSDKIFMLLEQIFIIGLAIVIPIVFLGTDPSGPQRILYYFCFYLIFIIPILLNKYNNIYLYLLFVVLASIYFCLVTSRIYEIYPYVLNPVFDIL